ncbi:CorA family divalent cation transporter [Streptomyces virginiae]|uniref:CorA family divalent cation transporter n=1 Tax=Streptomyces virginiae TaxID=1961 RepID=UPI003668EA33
MIVSVVSMPEGVVARTALSEVRERLAAPDFVIVDIDQGEDAPSDEQPLARSLSLDDTTWEWLGRRNEPVRADYHAGVVGCVVPVIDGSLVKRIHVFAGEGHLVTVHHGPVGLIDTFIGRLPEDTPSSGATAVFLLLHGVLEVFRKATAQALLEVGEVEEAMLDKLAIASVIFLPLSFLTGFFGMNFSFLSNNLASEQTFLWLGIGMRVCALVVAMYVVLCRTHWRRLRDDDRSHDAAGSRLPDPS